MASGSTRALLEPSPAARPLAAARMTATNTAANVATFIQSTRGVVVSSAVAIRGCYDRATLGRPPDASDYRAVLKGARHPHGNSRLLQGHRKALLGARPRARDRRPPAPRLLRPSADAI